MIKTARQLKDLIRNLARNKSADAQLHDGTLSGTYLSFKIPG